MAHIHIDNPQDKSLDPFCRIPDFRLRKGEWLSTPCFVTESRRDLASAVELGFEPLSLFLEESWLEEVEPEIQLVAERFPDVSVLIVDAQTYATAMNSPRSYGIMGLFKRQATASLESVLENATRVCVVENVINAENVGSIFKAALAFGLDGLLLTHSCHDPFYRRALRVTKGASFQVPWCRIGSTNDWAPESISELQGRGYKVAALALSDDSISLEDPLLDDCEKLALVLGTEGEGLLDSTIELCDYVVRIPMRAGVDSLNVAAAGAASFWQVCRKRIP